MIYPRQESAEAQMRGEVLRAQRETQGCGAVLADQESWALPRFATNQSYLSFSLMDKCNLFLLEPKKFILIWSLEK